MKLYIPNCYNCNNKIPLGFVVQNRYILRNTYGDYFNIECPTCGNVGTYSPLNVWAETDSNAALGGGVVGGLIGLLGGPLGVIIGGAIGAGLGNENDASDKAIRDRFNNS